MALPVLNLSEFTAGTQPGDLHGGGEEAGDGSGSEYRIVLPCIVIFGLCGNVISLVAIFHSRLRKMPANQYLIVLTLADSVFLALLLLVLFKADFVTYGICVAIEYVLTTASYVSSWSIAALTLERYLAIAHPLKHVQYGGISRWRLMAIWLPIPFLMNIIQFVILIPNEEEGGRKCTLRDGKLQLVAEISDVALSYLLPCLIVVTLNLLIAMNIRSARRQFPVAHSQKRTKGTGKESGSATPSTAQPSSGSTRILFVVPVVYIILNTPFYLIRLSDTIAINLFDSRAFSIENEGEGQLSLLFVYCYNGAHYLYYVNFACDVVVYAFSSSNFRRTVMIAWKSLLCPTSAASSEYLASTTARNVQPSTRPLSANNRNSTMVNVSPPNGTKSEWTRNGVESGPFSGGRRNVRLLSLSLDDGEVGRPLIAASVSNAPSPNRSSIIRKPLLGTSKERVETMKLGGSLVIGRQHDAENATSSLLLPYHSPTVVETISIRHSNVL